MGSRPAGHSAIWVRELVDDLAAAGIPPERLLGNLGITRADIEPEDARLSIALIAEVFERAAELSGDDLLGIHRGAARDNRAAGLIAYVGLAAPTVAHYLRNLARYRRVFSDALEIDVSRLPVDGTVSWSFPALAVSHDCKQFREFGAAGILADLRKLTGTDLRGEELTFRHLRPLHAREVEGFFGCRIVFGAEANTMRLSPAALDLPLLTRDDRLLRILQQFCEETIAKLPGEAPSSRVAVERALAEGLSSGVAEQPAIARRLGMSARTLTRRLAAEGTTFQAVLTDYRRELAHAYLTRSDLQMLQIAFLLGFSDAASFSAAFRRWTGRTPRSVRQSARP